MANQIEKQIGTFVKKNEVDKMHVVWEGTPSRLPYLLFKSDFILYCVLAGISMILVNDSTLRISIYVGLLVCAAFAVAKVVFTNYFVMKEGLIIQVCNRYYYISWHEIDWSKSVKATDQFKTRSYSFAGPWQIAHSKFGYLQYATMWYLKNPEEMVSKIQETRFDQMYK